MGDGLISDNSQVQKSKTIKKQSIMEDPKDLAAIFAVVLSLAIPIVAIISAAIVSMRKKNRETELRKAIIENNVTDPESIKLLVEEKEKDKKQDNQYSMLRGGCILLGAGLGAIISNYFGSNRYGIDFWIPIIAGMGLGMLIAFIIEYNLTKKEKQQKPEEQES